MQALDESPRGYIPPANQLRAVEAAAVAACDANDGVKDGVIDDPTKCHFDPPSLACKGAASDSCLTEAQVAALKKIYAGPREFEGRAVVSRVTCRAAKRDERMGRVDHGFRTGEEPCSLRSERDFSGI